MLEITMYPFVQYSSHPFLFVINTYQPFNGTLPVVAAATANTLKSRLKEFSNNINMYLVFSEIIVCIQKLRVEIFHFVRCPP